MAKIIRKKVSKCEEMIERISWKESLQIYCYSVLIMFYVCAINLFKLVKFYFNERVGQKVMKQIRILSMRGDSQNYFNRRESVRRRNKNTQAVSPVTQTSKLGSHNYIKIKTTRFHYVESGETNSEVILLLHGFPDCWFGWRNQIKFLSQNHRVIALDLKGFNDSDKPSMRYHYRPEKLCEELKQFLEAINVKSVSIIGHDIGAIVGWFFAHKHPECVNKFISINTPHPNLFCKSAIGAFLTSYWFCMFQIPILPERELKRDQRFIRETLSHLTDEMSNEISHGGENFKRDNLLETYEYIFSRTSDWTGAINYFRNFLFYRVSPSYTVRCPCVIIFGTENSNFKLESAIKSAEYCENPLIKIIDGAGYYAHQTNATELNAILLKYLVGEKNNNNGTEQVGEGKKSLMTRMMNKVYSVGQSSSNKWINYS